MIDGILKREEEVNVENVINLGKSLKVNLTRGDIDVVHRLNTKSKTETRFSNSNAKSQLYKSTRDNLTGSKSVEDLY